MIKIKSTWWHRLVRVAQSTLIVSLGVVLLFLNWGDTKDKVSFDRVWFVPNDDGYSRTLKSVTFDCVGFWKESAVAMPKRVEEWCDAAGEDFLNNHALSSKFTSPGFDPTDQTAVSAVLVAAAECDSRNCAGFVTSKNINDELWDRFEAYRSEFPKWYSSLDQSSINILHNFHLVTAKYEDLREVEEGIPAYYILGITLLVMFAMFIFTELIYRLGLFVAFGKKTFNFKID